MKYIVEFAGIISIADNIEFQSLSRFQESVFDLRLEDRYLLAGEGMELRLDFGIVHNCHLLMVILQHLHLSKIELFGGHCHFGSIRVGADVEQMRLVVIGADDVNVEREGDLAQLGSYQGYLELF